MTQTDSDAHRQVLQMIRQAAGVGTPAPDGDGDAVDYPWDVPQRFTPRQSETLRKFAGRAAETVAKRAGRLLNEEWSVSSAEITQQFAPKVRSELAESGEFLIPIASGSDQPCGTLAVAVQQGTAWVQHLLGGSGSAGDAEKELSALETAILLDAVSSLVVGISEAAADYGGLDLRVIGDILRGELELFSDESMDYTRFDFQFAHGDSTMALSIVISSQLLVPICAPAVAGESQEPQGPGEDERRMRGHIDLAYLLVDVELGTARITMRDIMALSPGDVMLLDKKVNEAVDLRVRGVGICRGFPVRCGEAHGFRVAASGQMIDET